MVDRCKIVSKNSAMRNIRYMTVDEESMSFDRASVDLIISSLSLHWTNDLPKTLKEIQKTLKPNGAFLGALLGGDTLEELRIALTIAEQEREGGISPHISPMAQGADIGDLLVYAGFALPTVDVQKITVEYPCPFTLMHHLQCMGESNALLGRRAHVSRETFIAAASIYQKLFGTPSGGVTCTFEVIFMIGWSPHQTQQKPLERGSAIHSFKNLSKVSQESNPNPLQS